MTREQALALGDRICEFLVSCGGAYRKLTGELQWNVFHALGARQYVFKEEDREIVYFASWWKVTPEDAADMMEHRMQPIDLKNGSVVYVTEAANKGTRKDMAEMIARIRQKEPMAHGVFWRRPVKQDKVYHFPRQRGKEA